MFLNYFSNLSCGKCGHCQVAFCNKLQYLVSLFRHQGIEGVVADELALLPGAEEVAALLAVEEATRSGAYDLCIVDCAPTGSTLRLVTLPEVGATNPSRTASAVDLPPPERPMRATSSPGRPP